MPPPLANFAYSDSKPMWAETIPAVKVPTTPNCIPRYWSVVTLRTFPIGMTMGSRLSVRFAVTIAPDEEPIAGEVVIAAAESVIT